MIVLLGPFDGGQPAWTHRPTIRRGVVVLRKRLLHPSRSRFSNATGLISVAVHWEQWQWSVMAVTILSCYCYLAGLSGVSSTECYCTRMFCTSERCGLTTAIWPAMFTESRGGSGDGGRDNTMAQNSVHWLPLSNLLTEIVDSCPHWAIVDPL